MIEETRPFALCLALERGVSNPPDRSPWHGEDHWKSVAMLGFYLSRWTPGADLEFIFTFAMLHDVMRENEYEDPLHGARASQLFVNLCERPGLEHFPVLGERTMDMCYALGSHCLAKNARDHRNVNVGLCWDADRLTLRRVGIEPEDRYLTTAVARQDPAKTLGRQLAIWQLNGHTFPTWEMIAEEIQTWRL